MVRIEWQRSLAAAAGVLAFAAAGLQYAALAQPPAESGRAASAIDDVLARIADIQTQDGVHSVDLIDPLTTLSTLYEEASRLEPAAAAVEQARQVLRANYGLRTLEEAPLILRSIRLREAAGDFAGAWDIEQKLLELLWRHPNDVRTVPILLGIANKRMDVLRRYQAGEFPPQLYLGCYYGGPPTPFQQSRNCRAGSRRIVIQTLAAEVYRYNARAEQTKRRHESWVAAPACERPGVPEIPTAEGQRLAKRVERVVDGQVLGYLRGMSSYVGCVQAKYRQAATDGEPPERLAELVAENNAAVAEATQLVGVYEARVGPISELR